MVFTLDMIVSVVFFMAIVLTMLWVWTASYMHMEQYNDLSARSSRLDDIGTMLVTTGGSPSDWHQGGPFNADRILALGLARGGNELDPERLDRFVSLDYELLRRLLGLGSEDFHFTVTRDWEGTPDILYEKGSAKATSEVYVVRRFAALDGEAVELRLAAYYDKR